MSFSISTIERSGFNFAPTRFFLTCYNDDDGGVRSSLTGFASSSSGYDWRSKSMNLLYADMIQPLVSHEGKKSIGLPLLRLFLVYTSNKSRMNSTVMEQWVMICNVCRESETVYIL